MKYSHSDFREILDPEKYVESGIESGIFAARLYVKTARIRAVQGTPDRVVETVLKNGLRETVNIIRTDQDIGVPDWIVTSIDGEQYVVTDKTFREKYIPDPSEPDMFLPVGKPIKAVQIKENIRFTAPWGEEQLLSEGGYLMLDPGGIYGVSAVEFEKTYRQI